MLFEQQLISPDVQLNELILGLETTLFANPIDKDLTTPPGSESDFDLYIVAGTAHAIASFTASTNTIALESGEGDLTSTYTAGKVFTVKAATDSDNNGQFTVVSSSFSSATSIVVAETIADEGSSPASAYIAGGTWNGHVDHLAIYYNGQYYFKTPLEGWGPVYIQDQDLYHVFDGTDWTPTSNFSGAASNTIQDNVDGGTSILCNETEIEFDVNGAEVGQWDATTFIMRSQIASANNGVLLDFNLVNAPDDGTYRSLRAYNSTGDVAELRLTRSGNAFYWDFYRSTDNGSTLESSFARLTETELSGVSNLVIGNTALLSDSFCRFRHSTDFNILLLNTNYYAGGMAIQACNDSSTLIAMEYNASSHWFTNKVGINKAPGTYFTVASTLDVSSASATLANVNAATGNNAGLSLSVNATAQWLMVEQPGSSDKLGFFNASTQQKLTLQQTGELGVFGVTSPATALHIGGALTLNAVSTPSDPANNQAVIWMDTSGNIQVKSTVSSTTHSGTIYTY